MSSSIYPSLQTQRVEQLALVQPPKNLRKAMQILIRPDSYTIAFLEGTTQQRDSYIADLAELQLESDKCEQSGWVFTSGMAVTYSMVAIGQE